MSSALSFTSEHSMPGKPVLIPGGASPIQCKGTEHDLGTHGHDRGPARFIVRAKCSCGWCDERPLCAGRVHDMLRSPGGIRCAGCGSVYSDVAEFARIEPLRRAEGALLAVQDTSRIVGEFVLYERAQGFSESTIKNRLSCVRALERASGHSLLEVDAASVVAYLGRPNIKASSRRTNQIGLKAFFQFAVEQKYRATDPTDDLPAVRVPKGTPRPFTKEQIDAMLTSGAYRKTRAMILLGYYQGFRVSSIARVHGHDIDLLAGTIRTIGKGGKEGALPLHPVIAELAKHMPTDDWWFPGRQGRPGHIDGSGVTGLLTRAKKRAGITDPRLTPHSLRHSFATHLVDGGVDIRVVQELMMHDSLVSTQVYAGVSESRKRDGIRSLPSMGIPARSRRKSSSQ